MVLSGSEAQTRGQGYVTDGLHSSHPQAASHVQASRSALNTAPEDESDAELEEAGEKRLSS